MQAASLPISIGPDSRSVFTDGDTGREPGTKPYMPGEELSFTIKVGDYHRSIFFGKPCHYGHTIINPSTGEKVSVRMADSTEQCIVCRDLKNRNNSGSRRKRK